VIADPQLNIQTAAAPTAVPGAATGLNVQARPAAPANPANNGGASNSNAPLRVSGEIQTARLIRRVTPTYPPVARAAKIQGTVRFAAVINKEGHIDGLKLVSGPAPLVGAASEAVKQWQYQPTLVNGRPVEVETQITVDFKLN
jgi:protein TonB